MVLGGDVPLEEDILKKKVEFLRNFKEQVQLVGRRRIINGNVSSTLATIYTVPQNKTAYITFIHLSGASTGATVADEKIIVQLDGGNESFIVASLAVTQNCNIIYDDILELDQNQVLEAITTDTTINGHISLIVYELDKKITP